MNTRLLRRRVLGGSLVTLAGAACAPRAAPLAGIVALPERSLAYAPLLLAAKGGLYHSPALRTATLLRSGGGAVAAAVVAGDADAGALSLPDFLDAVEAGAPLVAIGALTRRFAGQLVAATSRSLTLTVDALLSGGWRAVPLGVQIGGDGTERFLRALFLSSSTPLAPLDRPFLAGDPLMGEPRFVGYRTDEALVAALRDGRIDAFVGHAMAAAPATLLGGCEVVANFSLGAIAAATAAAHGVVLATRRDRVTDASADAANGFLGALVRGVARASGDLSGPERVTMAQRALPDRDALHLAAAIQLEAPSAEQSVYAAGGRIPAEALPVLLVLRARAGRPAKVDGGPLVAQL